MTQRLISFFNNELLEEGSNHNRALYSTISYGRIDIPQVLFDNGSGLNVCIVITLRSLGHSKADL